MLMGRYEYSLDAKSRVNFPPKFRAEMGDNLYVTKWFDGCLVVYGERRWQSLDEKFARLPVTKSRDLRRIIYGNATEVQPDKQGRIAIAPALRAYAGLTSEVVVVGMDDHAEIWDKAAYKAYTDSVSAEDIAALAEEIGI